ncbi:MAG: hypothetical protein ISR57_07095 [Bacteroidales bacterium]|nr:hypothetical protein [Bacteroidota bacterium]MBL6950395.1 hypothetical protein [Bacteroidales bacterium]
MRKQEPRGDSTPDPTPGQRRFRKTRIGDRLLIKVLPSKPPKREAEAEAGKNKKGKPGRFASHNNRSLTHQAATAA